MLTMRSQPRYGLEIIEMVYDASDSHIEIQIGSLYPLLKRLKRTGLLETAKVTENLAVRGNHTRKYSQLTVSGQQALARAEQLRRNLRNWDSPRFSDGLQPS